MFDPELYGSNNDLQKQGAEGVIREYISNIKWKRNPYILDVGSGDGCVTATVLQKHVPSDYNCIIGMDISNDMVQHSNKYYSNDRIKFMQMDISDGLLPTGFEGSFNHVFSFYTLHWVKEQQKAFEKIHDLLSEGGDCLVMFPGKTPVYDVFRIMSQRKRWRPWLAQSVGTFDRYISRYHDTENPEEEVRKVMMEAGFRNIYVKCMDSTHVFSGLKSLKGFIQPLNPFKVPNHLLDQFGEEAIQVLLDLEAIQRGAEDDQMISFTYIQIVAYGNK